MDEPKKLKSPILEIWRRLKNRKKSLLNDTQKQKIEEKKEKS